MYDLAIIGGGPAGLTAGLYGARANLKTVIIEKGLYGGQMQNTLEIENYPGFDNIGGPDLSEHMYQQALAVGCEWKYGEVTKVNLEGQPKTVEVGGEVIEARQRDHCQRCPAPQAGCSRRKGAVGPWRFLLRYL